jgi:hypothetical protein
MEILKLLIRVMIFLLFITITGCGTGWSVGGYQITPQDTVSNTVFIEIMGTDSVVHYYHGTVYTNSNWCWRHHQFEDIANE